MDVEVISVYMRETMRPRCNLVPRVSQLTALWGERGETLVWSGHMSARQLRTSMALYPRQNSNSCLQHCCFELLLVFTFRYPTSTIQHCPFTIQCVYFKCNVVTTWDILIQCSICLYGVKCDMLPTQSNILVQFLYSKSIDLFCFQIYSFNMQHSCLSIQFWYSVWMLLCRVRYACYTIQYSCLDIELHARVTWPWVGRPLDKGLSFLQRINIKCIIKI